MYNSVFLHTINCMIGSGILAIPYTACLLGNALFLVFVCCVAVWAFLSLVVLFNCTRDYYGNMEDLAQKAFGRLGYVFMVILLIFENLGSICSYLFVILYMCKSVIVYFEPEFVLAVLVLFVLFPISIPKSVTGLGVFSFVAIVFVLGFLGYVITYLGIFGIAASARGSLTISYLDVPKCMSILMFAFVCHPTAITLAEYGTNRCKTLLSFTMAFIVCTLIYLLIGFCGYLSFGTQTPDNMIQAYSDVKYGIGGKYILPIVISVSVIFTIPALLIPLKKIMAKVDFSYNQWLSTLLVYIVLYFLVIFIPKFENILTLVGAGAASTIMFIVSPVIYLKLINGKSCVVWIMLVLGIVCTLLCMTFVVNDFVTPFIAK
ncbi:transmembrane amino acid transporter protein [European chub iridovirus]|nr:transmembrane amino acid transporter protein [European chub iridovirus]